MPDDPRALTSRGSSDHATHRREAGHVARWATSQKLTKLEFPATRWDGPSGIIDTETRWQQARACCTTTPSSPEDRVAGLFVLLYAQWPAAISRLTLADIDSSNDNVRLHLVQQPVVLPEPLAPEISSTSGPAGATKNAARCEWVVPVRAPTLSGTSTQVHTISILNVFLRRTLAWGWDDVPDRPLLSHLDMPMQIKPVPRYLPAPELDAVVEGIRALADPYQRAACPIARWVGPRRSEILRLELDCLDTYPDGHPRLRIPAGKTYTERMVPLHPEAADALRICIEQTRIRRQRPLIDEVTGKPTHYVFQLRGRLLSHYFLFDSALQ